MQCAPTRPSVALSHFFFQVGFRDLSFNVYEEDGREYVEMEGILQLLIPLK